MSSISLPKVLQQRKSNLDIERESFEKFQATSISKAINQVECPVKEKHVRIAIIGTYRDRSAELFWQCVSKVPLQENRIVAWKFCHVLHKLLREGHQATLQYSLRHKRQINDLGRLWGHLKEGYGKLIQHYCNLLIVKLDFHERNPGFPGNLQVSTNELEKIGEHDINNYFQISVEMFDYMDEILDLQNAIFSSLDMSRSNSMTMSGQCRLAPLILCIQDSSQLYDCCVKFLFKLYARLSPDILVGHRQRFLKQFQLLRQFYLASSNLQYFKNLIQIPLLPENPPNILVQAELRTYVTPVVVVPEEETSDQTANDLVDVSSESSQNCSRSISPDLLAQRDNLIEHLQNEISNLHVTIIKLKTQITSLEEQVFYKENEFQQEKKEKETLAMQVQKALQDNENEDKVKMVEDKFNKLKEVYYKLREEHITLIRQKADVDKQLASVKNIDVEIADRAKLEEELATLQATADLATQQNETLICKVQWAAQEKELMETKLQDTLNSKDVVENELANMRQYVNSNKRKIFAICREIVEHSCNDQDITNSSMTCSPECFEGAKMKILNELSGRKHYVMISHYTAQCILFAKALSNSLPDFDVAEKMEKTCKEIKENCLELLTQLESTNEDEWANLDCTVLCDKINSLSHFEYNMTNGNSLESLSDLVETELATMDKAIEQAVCRIQEMLKESRAADSGIKLEVNEKILDSCTSLMNTIKLLVKKSRLLQAEIVGTTTPTNGTCAKEFYKRNHQWTEGLISAAKAVGMAAQYLLTAADEVVGGKGKLERLIVAAQGVAASTAQLVVASRVKADRNSSNLSGLSTASRDVTNATANVVATVKSCSQLVEESEDLDFTGLSLHQAKRLEMDSQVRVLELEAGLEKERLRLSALRRYHYQLSGDLEQT